MTTVRVTLHPHALPLRKPWSSAAGRVDARRGWLLALRDESGRVGYGECTPLPQAGSESEAVAGRWITAWAAAADGARRSHLESALSGSAAPPAVRCAVESALLDLRAQASGQSLARYLDSASANAVRVNAVIGALDDAVVERMENGWLEGFRVFKVKVGLHPVAEELERLRHLAERLPGGVLRLDANGAWGREEALRMIDGLNELPVESLEEPLREPDLGFLALLQRRACFPLALDESLIRIDREALFRRRSVRRVVLKPPVHGGIAPTLALARRARAAGMGCVVTTMLEGAAGGWLSTQLAAVLDDGLTAHGLATAGWLERDIGEPPRCEQGRIEIRRSVGLGFRPTPGLS